MRKSWLVLLGALLLAACEDDKSGGDGAADADLPPLRRRDAAVTPPTRRDAAMPGDDAAVDPGADAAPGDPDAAGPDDPDAAAPDQDAAAGRDAAVEPERDAAMEPERDAAVEPEPDAAIPDVVDPDCRAALAAAEFTFEAGPQGWAHRESDNVDPGIGWPFDSWEHGGSRRDPDSCHEGRSCWGTDLDDNLIQCQRAQLDSPLLDLRACAGHDLTLVFDHWYSFWAGHFEGFDYYDGGTVWAGREVDEVYRPIAGAPFPGVIRVLPDIGFGYACVAPNDFHIDGHAGYVLDSGGWVEARLPLGRLHAESRIGLHFAYATGVSEPTFDPGESQLSQPSGWTVDHVRFEVR